MDVLLVEDDATTRFLLTQALREAGHEVAACSEAEQAWEIYQARPAPLLVVDWVLPGMSGLALCRKVRAHPTGSHCVILMITSRNSAADLEAVIEAGADDYLSKPVDVGLLRIRLKIAERHAATLEQRRSTEFALRQTEHNFQRVTRVLRDYTYAVTFQDGAPAHTQHSAACVGITGYAPEHFAADPFLWINMVHEDDRDYVRRHVDLMQQGQDVPPIEHRIVRRDGELRWIRNTMLPKRSPKGQLLQCEGIVQDITEHRRAQEEQAQLARHVRQAERLESLGILAGGVAHDFNNILAAIIGYTGLAIEDAPPGRTAANLRLVLSAAERAKDLVHEILAFSRDSEELREPVVLQQLLAQTAKFLRATLPATIDIQRDVEPAVATVLGNATQLQRVLVNLSTNAAQAMAEEGGVITLELAVAPKPPVSCGVKIKRGPCVRLSVCDTGPGIDPAAAARMFEPFFTTKGPGEGTGLGLAMVQRIVDSHGGAIAVGSKPGKGARFDVYLPLLPAPRMQPAPEPEPAPARGHEHVLFVDDEQALAHLGKQMLQRQGYTVTATVSSRDALDQFRAAPDQFDVLVTDMTMPHLTGDALAREVLALRPGMPIILTTGFSRQFTEEKARTLGIREMLIKPVPGQELARAIRRVLDAEKTAEN